MHGTNHNAFTSIVQHSRLTLYRLAQLCHAAVQTVYVCWQRAALFQITSSAVEAHMRLAGLLSGSGQWFFTAL